MITETRPDADMARGSASTNPSSCCAAETGRAGLDWVRLRGIILTGALLLLILWAWWGPAPRGFIAAEAKRNVLFVLASFWSIAPFFLLSVAVSAWVTVAGYADKIRGVFNKRRHMAIAGAATVGAVVPFCSCGVIPLIAAMLTSGVPLGPVMAFWISSPLMSPEKFVLTAGVLGTDYAIGRLAFALILGTAAGYVTYLAARLGKLEGQIKAGLAPAGGTGAERAGGGRERPPRRETMAAFASQMMSVGLYLSKWLVLAFFLEALIVHYIDPAWIGAILGGENPWSIPLATAVGIPLYTSGVAAIPITKGLIAAGMGAGPAMAFLIAGPSTCIPAMAGVWALVKRKVFAIYLCVGIVGSLFAGYAFQLLMG